MNRQSATKPFSTSARVHPSYLPFISNPSRGKGLKWVPPIAALVVAGYGVASYREAQVERHLATEQAELERRRRTVALADAYGGGNSLEDLEHAMRVYEAQQGNE
ncbi:hypothetical protein B0T25DRAFT_188181 [Lasiosphaeria hispida]|uniref:Uncharacterized protein n=1 Tax=Lasiosphaeria hispida TaxID=260671 RepID=A0AAJ0MDK2_9PEZI|nr:hypothetical protein B0T25DRAFT_188181 [Lasiosphaeria hispida]